jgi:hypothetical protein
LLTSWSMAFLKVEPEPSKVAEDSLAGAVVALVAAAPPLAAVVAVVAVDEVDFFDELQAARHRPVAAMSDSASMGVRRAVVRIIQVLLRFGDRRGATSSRPVA